jgi:hypothetical protein
MTWLRSLKDQTRDQNNAHNLFYLDFHNQEFTYRTQ